MSSSSFCKDKAIIFKNIRTKIRQTRSSRDDDWCQMDAKEATEGNPSMMEQQESRSVRIWSTHALRDSERIRSLPSTLSNQLQVLDLTRSRYLLNLQGIEQCTALETINVTDCWALTELPECVGQLGNLKKIIMADAPNIARLPDSIGNCSSLEELRFGGSSGHHNRCLVELPESLSQCSQLRTLVLDKCKALRNLVNMDQFIHLERLQLRECKSLTRLPSLDQCTQLRELNLLKCVSLESLVPLDALVHLEDLILGKCFALPALPALHLPALVCLDLRQATALQSLPNLDALVSLKTLQLKGCTSLQSIPMSIVPLLESNLQMVVLTECASLTQVPEAVRQYQKRKK